MSKLLNVALTQIGIEEIAGAKDEPEILKYFAELGFDAEKLKDETAWCSAVLNYLCKKADLPHTGKLNARSWLSVGVPVENPKPGDLVVFWRGNNPDETIAGSHLKKGHVGIYMNKRNGLVWTLGGNQSNMFIMSPYSESKVLGYRRLEF